MAEPCALSVENDYFEYLICVTLYLLKMITLTHSFPMHPVSTP